MIETVAAAVGEQNMQIAFWVVVGGLVLSNAGLLVQAFLSSYRNKIKMRADLNEAFKRIRALEKEKEK